MALGEFNPLKCQSKLQLSYAGGLCQIIGYAIDSPAPPFPVLILGYVFNGFGIALQDAQANGYVAGLQEGAAAKMGLLHAAYGM